jgi:hypothetical protein
MTTGAPPRWQPDPAGEAYTLISGDIRCRVWHMLGTWNAIVNQRGDATAAYAFETAEAAQAWCETIMGERRSQ